jgi:hypothetical protein
MPALQLHAEGKAVVQLVLPPSMVTRLNEIALRRGVNRSWVIREALQQVYFASPDAGTPDLSRMKGDAAGGISDE